MKKKKKKIFKNFDAVKILYILLLVLANLLSQDKNIYLMIIEIGGVFHIDSNLISGLSSFSRYKVFQTWVCYSMPCSDMHLQASQISSMD